MAWWRLPSAFVDHQKYDGLHDVIDGRVNQLVDLAAMVRMPRVSHVDGHPQEGLPALAQVVYLSVHLLKHLLNK